MECEDGAIILNTITIVKIFRIAQKGDSLYCFNPKQEKKS